MTSLPIKIHYREVIEGSPVVRFVAKAWCSLMDEGLWEKNSVLVSGDLQCVFAADGRKIVGCLTFHIDGDQAIINIAYVRNDYRGKGVYRALHDAFAIRAKEQGAKWLVNICYATNTAIRSTCTQLGYTLSLEHWKKKL